MRVRARRPAQPSHQRRIQSGEVARSDLSRLASELHDRVAQSLWVLDLGLHDLDSLLGGDVAEARNRLQPLRRRIAQTYRDIRLAIGAMRSSPPIHLELARAIRSHTRMFSRETGIAIHLRFPSRVVPLPKLVELQVLAILHQALSNVRKHSAATEVVVALDECDDGWILSVEDNGQGFCPSALSESAVDCHFGLAIMTERAQSFGGSVTISSSNGRGATIRVFIPGAIVVDRPCPAKRRRSSGGRHAGPTPDRR